MALTRQELQDLLEPAVARLGFEIADLELHTGRGRGLLRVFIDGPAGVTVDDCEAVSRQVSAVLDVADPITGAYSLEVSSPGLDRRLAKPGHYDRFAGAEVQIRLRRLIDGRRKVRGTLLRRDGGSIEVRSEGAVLRIPLAEVDVARLVPDLRATARPESAGKTL
jgi:ribosome maturation factor RimP